jgi:hypothetical protein
VGASIGPVVAPREPRVGDDVHAVHLLVGMKGAYVGPDVGSLAQMYLTVGALEPLGGAALVCVVSNHVAAVLVGAVTAGTRVPLGLILALGVKVVGARPVLVRDACKIKERGSR